MYDVLLLSNDLRPIFTSIGETFSLKKKEWGPPTQYLGAQIERFHFSDSTYARSMSSNKYVASTVEIFLNLLVEDGKAFKVGKKQKGPLPSNYRPELDTTNDCSASQTSRFQQLIGIGCWAVELG